MLSKTEDNKTDKAIVSQAIFDANLLNKWR